MLVSTHQATVGPILDFHHRRQPYAGDEPPDAVELDLRVLVALEQYGAAQVDVDAPALQPCRKPAMVCTVCIEPTVKLPASTTCVTRSSESRCCSTVSMAL
jgi:hypothetical protein